MIMRRRVKRADGRDAHQPPDHPDSLPVGSPLIAHLCLTTQCNLHCKGCYAVDGRGPAQYLDFDLALAILPRLQALGFSVVWFGGGEPLLYPHLFPLAWAARELGQRPRLSTNASLLDAGVARRCGVFDEVHIGLHTPEDLPTLEAAAGFLRAERVAVVLDVLLTRRSFSRLPEIFAWARRQRIPRASLRLFRVTASNARNQNMRLLPEQEEELLPLLLTLSEKHRIAVEGDCGLLPAAARQGLSERQRARLGLEGCPGGLRSLAIDVAGRYRPCLFWPESFGEALDLSLHEWLHGAALAAFRQSSTDGRCNDCNFAAFCNQPGRLFSAQMCDVE